MPVVVLHPRVDAQIVDVLSHTLEQFGEAKYLEYRELVRLALTALEVAPWTCLASVLANGESTRAA